MPERNPGASSPGWAALACELLTIAPTGPSGFEGLMAAWLSQLLDEPFYVARTGRQPLGDAANHSLEVGVQAKLYERSSRPRIIEILGDLRVVGRHLEDIQVYVLASTADLDTDRHKEIRDECAEKGIDYVFLGLSEEGPSDLGALAVAFWDEVTSSFLSPSPEMTVWAKAARSEIVSSHLPRLQEKLKQSVASRRALAERSREFVLERLFPAGPRPISGTSVDEAKLVERLPVYASLDQWWNSPSRPLLVVGEEGLGKSWAVAGWLRHRFESLGLPVVWFDSHRWQDIRSLDQLAERVAQNLCQEISPPEWKRRRILRKLTDRWPAPSSLLILDGANEGSAPEAATQILKEILSAEGERFAQRFKLIITTRPPEPWLPIQLGRGCTRIQVHPLTLEELDKAVRRISGGQLRPEDLPEPLRETARRPRYLELTFDLRDRLGDLAEVTVEAVLFARLMDLLEREEMPRRLGVARGRDVFARLVEVTVAEGGFRVLEDESALNSLAPNGAQAFHDLQDAGWVRDTGEGRRILTETHVRLAWALFFLRLTSRQRRDTSLIDRIEEVRAVQDPGLNDDLRSLALGTALELLTSGLDAEGNRYICAPLLAAWALSHNSRLQGPTFAAILEKYPEAYCETIEALITLAYELPWEEYFAEPLAEQWKSGGTTAEAIRPFLERWLLFVWSPEGEGDSIGYEGVTFPRITRRRLLDLEELATAVVAHRPDPAMLRTLCRQAGSWERSRNENGMPLKDPWQWAGTLMRWSFGEHVIPELERIASDPRSAPFEVLGAQRLAWALRQVRLPARLQPKRRGKRERRVARFELEQEVEVLRSGQPGLLSSLEPGKLGSRYWPNEIAALAADPSIPDLQLPDVTALRDGLALLVQGQDLFDGRGAGEPEHALEAWLPWLARSDAEAWAKLVGQLVERALGYATPHYLLSHCPALLPWPAGERLSAELPQVVRATAQKRRGGDPQDDRFRLLDLICLAVHLEDKGALLDSLEALASRPDPLKIVRYDPVLPLLNWTIDPGIYEAADSRSRGRLRKHRAYWLWIQIAHAWRWPAERKLEFFGDVEGRALDLPGIPELLFDFLLSVDHPSVLRRILGQSRLAKLLGNPHHRVGLADWARWQTSVELPDGYEKLRELFPLQCIGPWLLVAGGSEDFQHWGTDLMSAMRVQVESMVAGNPPAISVIWQDAAGRKRAKLLADDQGFFGADDAFLEWARRYPEEFQEGLSLLLERLRPPFRRLHGMDGFVGVLAEAWMEREPRRAYDWFRQYEKEMHLRSLTNGVPRAVYHLWDLRICGSPAHRELRQHLLSLAKTDAEIAAHALAARRRGSVAELDAILQPLLRSRAQLDRVLAVSLLAWHPAGEEELERLKSDDPSAWVREHASWAFEVCRRDRIGREVYKEALRAPDALRQQAKLQMLAPLVLPTFEVWEEEDSSLRELHRSLDPQRRALLVAFQNRVASSELPRTTLLGRELAKHCRGEKLDRYTFGLGHSILPWK